MSRKWTGSQSESGILRKSEYKEKKEELFVFGYSCKLFRDDDKALHVDQGKHLIPWMGDETLKIDRYDARGALHDLSALEAPPGGYDWRVELTKMELEVEQLCDEERYRALHTDEDEEEMYKEEELKRLHAAGYGQVGFNYDAPSDPTPASQPTEVDEPFLPTTSFIALMPPDVVLPESQKQNAIIEKTAKFIASQGTQMEILIKAKQGDNPQFQFLNKDSTLHPYYTVLISLVKAGKWPEKVVEHIEEKPPEHEEYLHPSLASTVIESAPSIPSIHYKPSADCDYTMLISKMRGEATLDEAYTPELAPGEVAPPGTEPLPPRALTEISRGPVMYNTGQNQVDNSSQVAQRQQQYHQQYAAYYQQYMTTQAVPSPAPVKKDPSIVTPSKSTGLSLMKNYNTDSDSEDDLDDNSSTDSKDKLFIITPPEDVKVVIDKMAAYVARNGDEFAEIVRAKNDPRFVFLEPDNVYHGYYKKLMQEKRGDFNGTEEKSKKITAPVSFSIKKLKEPDPILPKPALPYESSSDEECENVDNQTDKSETAAEPDKENPPTPVMQPPKVTENSLMLKIEPCAMQLQTPKTNIPEVPTGIMPPVIVYKIEGTQANNLPMVKAIETINIVQKPTLNVVTPKIIGTPKPEEKLNTIHLDKTSTKENDIKKKSPTPEKRKDKRESSRDNNSSQRREKKKHRDRKKEYKSKSDNGSLRTSERRSVEREKKKEKARYNDRDRKKIKISEDNLENEIISLEDNSNDMIDLTGDVSDSKAETENETARVKQLARRRRAAEFLKKVGVDPGAAALPTTSLASAMVDTLETLRKKKAEEEEKRRRREKRRHRDRRDYEDESERSHRKSKRRRYKSSDDQESDYDSSKRRKRKKEKRHISKNKKKRKREIETEDDPPLNIDLTSTLKELRTTSPTKELGLQDIEENTQHSFTRQDSSSEDLEDETDEKKDKRKKKNESREYSEGEWSSDSEEDSDSVSSTNRRNDKVHSSMTSP